MLNEQHLSGCQTHTDGKKREDDECTRCPKSKSDLWFEPEACVSYLFFSQFCPGFSFFYSLVNANLVLVFETKEALGEECMKEGPSKGPSVGLGGGGGVAERQ